jgi:hypothetical protein
MVAAPMQAAAECSSVRSDRKRPQSDALGCHAGDGPLLELALDTSHGQGDEFRLLLGVR